MPIRWETFPIEVGGGLLEILPDIQQGMKAPGSAISLVNFESSLQGGYRRINGYNKFDTNAVPTGTRKVGVGFLEGRVLVTTAGTPGDFHVSQGFGWTTTASTQNFAEADIHRFADINLDGTPKLIGCNGTVYPYLWDGVSFSVINATSDILGTNHVVEFKDHVFYAAGGLVTFAAPFTVDDFDAGNGAGSFRMPNDVTGMIVFRERLFIFTENKIRVLDGDSSSDFRLTSVSESVGCIHRGTIQEVSGDVMFLAADGLRLLGGTDRIGDFANENASKNIQSLVTSFENTYDEFVSVTIREKSQYRIFGYKSDITTEQTDGFIGTQFESANPNSLQWSRTLGIKMNAAVSTVYQGQEVIYFVGDTNFVYQLEQGSTFDGTAIDAEYQTPFISMNDPTIRKTFYRVKTYLEAEGSIEGSVTLELDQKNPNIPQPTGIEISAPGGIRWNQFNWNEANWPTGQPDSSILTNVVGSGFSVSFRYRFRSEQDPFRIDTIFIEHSMEDRK